MDAKLLKEESLFNPEKEFFIIDSNNLEQIDTSLYGYCIQNDTIVTTLDKVDENKLDGNGAYIYIKNNADNILIKQDYIGSYMLYLYRDNDYFAISNSFQYLVKHIKYSHKISFNNNYAGMFLSEGLCSFSPNETLINEISIIARNIEIFINKTNKSIEFKTLDYKENTIEPDSEEGLKIIDEWFQRWTTLIRKVKSQGYSIITDLSGGMDSRLTLPLILGANINLNDIRINSIEPNSTESNKFDEDYEIANIISKFFHFELNKKLKVKYKEKVSANDSLRIAYYLKWGAHREMCYRTHKMSPIFYISGNGGEILRKCWDIPKETFLNSRLNDSNSAWKKSSRKIREKLCECIKNIVTNSYETVQKRYEKPGYTLKEEQLSKCIYKEARARNHFGKANIEAYFYGIIYGNPLLDPQLNKLKLRSNNCNDYNLLISIILDRFYPLHNFKFEKNRSIEPNTIKYGKEINKKYPFVNNSNTNAEQPEQMIEGNLMFEYEYTLPYKLQDNTDTIYKLFYSKTVKSVFKKEYGFHIYRKIMMFSKRIKHYPMRHIYGALAITKALIDVMENSYFLKNPNKINQYKNVTNDIFSEIMIDKNLYNQIKKENNILYKTFKKIFCKKFN